MPKSSRTRTSSSGKAQSKAVAVQDVLPENLSLLIPRPKARALLQEAIDEGKAILLKRTPMDLGERTPKAESLTSALKEWGASATMAMATCFGPMGKAAIISTRLSYTTLEEAKRRVRLKLQILQAALKHANRSRKARKTSPSRKPRSGKKTRLLDSANTIPTTRTLPEKLEHKYDFCLSFAGEDRKYAERLYDLLTQAGARVFYDFAEEHVLWGKDLYTHLQDVYQNQSRYCVMFTSKHYVQKAWTNVEREAAQARSFRQPEYILPIKLDNTPVPGLLETKGIVDIRRRSLEKIAQTAIKKLREAHPHPQHLSVVPPHEPKAPRTRTYTRTPGAKTNLVMLGEHFYRALRYHEAGNAMTLNILPRDDSEALRLRELAGQPYGQARRFAYGHGSGRARVQDVEYIEEGGRTQVVLKLQREPLHARSMTLGYDGEGRLERQLRWVIFGDQPPQNERYLLTNIDTTLSEELNAPILKTLWAKWKGTRAEFLEASRLLLLSWIQELGLIDQVSLINAGPWKKQNLPVQVKGSRKNAFATETVKVEVKGELNLPAKPA